MSQVWVPIIVAVITGPVVVVLQKLRKENRTLYYSPKIQNMMLQDRERLGDRFYNS